jgi:hypothetical protein
LEQRPALANITPDGLEILRHELRVAIIAGEKAKESLRLARLDSDHFRVMLEHERAEARKLAEDVRLLGSLIDRARNWVQDPELRAEITKHCPPKPRTESDHV